MFAKETSKKEQREDKGQQEEGPEDEAQLIKMIARLTLQHEFERMATARAENVALEFDANSEIMLAMEASKEAYGAEGEKSQEDQRRSVQGAPRRKETRRDVQDAGVSVGSTGGETEEGAGWSCGNLEGAVPRNSAASSTDNAHHGQASRERQRHENQEVLRCQIQRRSETMHQVDSGGTSSPGVHARIEHHEETKLMEAVQIKVEEDRATIEQGSQGYQGRSQGRRKRRWLFLRPKKAPKEVNRETSTARVRPCTKTKVERDFPGTSSLRRTSPWPGAEPLRGVARLGQVVASWGPLIIFKVPLSERDMQAECSGWHSNTSWAVAAACKSYTVQLLSVWHVGGSVSELRYCNFFPGTGELRPSVQTRNVLGLFVGTGPICHSSTGFVLSPPVPSLGL